MKKTMVRGVLGVALGVATLAVVSAPPTHAVDVSDDVAIDSERGFQYGIAHNPERNEYLAAYTTSDDVKVVLLDEEGAILSGPSELPTGFGFRRFFTDVSHNAATNQYLVSWSQPNGASGNAARTISVGQLVSETGSLVGGPVQLHPGLGTHLRCSSVWPQHEANPATGGYTLMYTYWYSTTSDNGPCDGLQPSETRTVVASLGGDLSLGVSLHVPGSNSGLKDNHVAVNPQTGAVLVLQRTLSPSGRAVMFSSALEQTGSFTFGSEDGTNNNEIQDPIAASEPATGNWLITWDDNGDGATMIVDAEGNEVVAPAARLNHHVLDVGTAPDGSYWGVSDLGYLVHIGADGTELLETKIARSGGHPALAIGTADFGVRGLAFMPTGSFSLPVIIPFSESPATLPLVPARILETREGTADGTVDGVFNGEGVRPEGSVLELDVAGRAGVPGNAGAALLNIAAAGASSRGFVTAFPCDADQPTSSNLNFEEGGAASAAAFVTLSETGTVCLFTSAEVDLIVDVNGYAPARASVTALTPGRLLETRSGTPDGTVDGVSEGEGRVAAGGVVEVKVTDRAGVAADAEAVVVNVTSINPSERIFVTVFACGSERPTAANLNAAVGKNVNNLVLAEVGEGGKVCIYSSGPTDLVMDVSAFVPAGGGLTASLPARLVETRGGTPDGTIDGDFEASGVLPIGALQVDVAGRGSVPENAGGVMLNVAAISPAAGGFMTLYPCDADQPTAANVNFAAGAVVSNAVFVKLDDSGRVCVFTSTSSHLAIDVVGYVL